MASVLLTRLGAALARGPGRAQTSLQVRGSTTSGGGGGGRKRRSIKWRLVKWTILPVGAILGGREAWKYIKRARRQTFEGPKKKVVILGSGWAALSVLQHLQPQQFDVTVVSPRNYFLFTPLLPSVTVGTVEARSIVEPLRKLIKKFHGGPREGGGVEFLEAECVDLDPHRKTVLCQDKSGVVGAVSEINLNYDILVVAVGATTNTFRTPGVEENCFFLKQIEDAQRIRNVVIDLVETASIPGQSEAEMRRLLHFVVVGGGPTGVEFAAEVRDFIREDVAKIYPRVHDHVTVTLVQSQDHVLNTYDKQISSYTEERFKTDGINAIVNSRVTKVGPDSLVIQDKKTKENVSVPYGICVWSTGVAPQPITRTFMEKIPYQSKGRALLTDKYLRVKGAEGVFAIGDCSTIEHDLMIKNAEQLFKEADVNGDGSLSLEEFHALFQKAKKRYPQIEVELSAADRDITKVFHEMDTSGDQRLDFDEFRHTLLQLDKKLKSLPATAQVASQQGSYLGDLLSSTNGEITAQSVQDLQTLKVKPFKYRHLGSFAYVGDNRAVLNLPIIGTLSGWWTMWLWRAAYASECASNRTKILVVGDWAKSYVFGRDSSRI